VRPECNPSALIRALAGLIDPDGTRMITGIRLESNVNQVPTLTVWEYVRPETLNGLAEIVSGYQLTPMAPQEGAT
jgi:hypothetical protein